MTHRIGRRLSAKEALALLQNADTAELMSLADAARRERHGAGVYYVHSLNLNPTNVCENQCGLCAFWREGDSQEAYTLSLADMQHRLEKADGWGLTDVHVVGGLNRQLDLDYYLDLLQLIKRALPGVTVQALTAVEVLWLSQNAGKSVAEVLASLKNAGLDAIPGGGAEIFSPRVRTAICPKKIPAEQWLGVHETAHSLGIPSNATMLFGHIETPAEIIDHLVRLRELQDRTGGFQAFCPLPFHAAGTRVGVTHGPGGHSIARIVALARIFLDNFPHIRVLANFLDRKLLGALLFCGADDVGGTSIDEQIARSAGAPQNSVFHQPDEMAAFVRELGLSPILTSSIYGGGIEQHGKRKVSDFKSKISDLKSQTPSLKSEISNLKSSSSLPAWRKILDEAAAGGRLTAEQAVLLADAAPFYELGQAAHARRRQVVGTKYSTFIIDRNISFTNICTVGCKFCAFHRHRSDPDSFAMPIEEIVTRVEEARELGATQIMLQGGLNPALDLVWYKEMLSTIKQRVPGIWLHSLSPAEVFWLARRSGLSVRDTLSQLAQAGLDSLPGGGAEILVDRIRQQVSPAKITTPQWLEVMQAAHSMGMRTTATMVYGLGETTADRIEHLLKVRDLQDRTGGFRAFIPWSFQANNTLLQPSGQTGVDYLRIVALSRLVLDNVDHVQAGWVTEGPQMAQMALTFGADDFGGVLMEESVVKATGLSFAVTPQQLISLIAETGMIPAQRNTEYEILHAFEQARPQVKYDVAV